MGRVPTQAPALAGNARAVCDTRRGTSNEEVMPKSKVRKKTDYTINPASRTPVKVKTGPSSSLYVALMLGLMLFGLIWLIVFYLVATPSALGGDGKILNWMYELGPWNFLIGFAFMVVGLLMTMRWR